MKTRAVTLEFVTPAFLGGADQSSEWRTPPIKAMLRQWWRIWAASGSRYNWKAVREIEGVIFGHAALEHNGKAWHIRSPVRLRLRPVRTDWIEDWSPTGKVHHPEVGKGPNGMDVGADLYLGYGPLAYQKGPGTVLKAPPALGPGSSGELLLRYPETLPVDEFTSVDVDAGLSAALHLAHLFGTVGSRSRNGWGSFELSHDGRPLLLENDLRDLAQKYARPLDKCLELEWPHAIGTDEKGLLLWRTKAAFRTWGEVMKELARVKIAFRTALDPGGRLTDVRERHVLAYPVTNHTVNSWGKNSRLANQLRFKVHRTGDGRFQGWAYHLPCGLPQTLVEKLSAEEQRNVRQMEARTWRKVHGILDENMDRWM